MGETVSLTLRFIGVTLDSLGDNATFLKMVFVENGQHKRVSDFGRGSQIKNRSSDSLASRLKI